MDKGRERQLLYSATYRRDIGRQSQAVLSDSWTKDKKQQLQFAQSSILNGQKKLTFTMIMVKNRNQLPKTIVESPLLEMLKASLVKALGNLINL